MRVFNIKFPKTNLGTIGYAGEHNITKLVFQIPDYIQVCDLISVSFQHEKAGNEIIRNTFDVNADKTEISGFLDDDITKKGVLCIQLIGCNYTEDSDDPVVVAKTPQIRAVIAQSNGGARPSGDLEQEIFELRNIIEDMKQLAQSLLALNNVVVYYELPEDAEEGDVCFLSNRNYLDENDFGSKIYLNYKDIAKLSTDSKYIELSWEIDDWQLNIECEDGRFFIQWFNLDPLPIEYNIVFENGEIVPLQSYYLDQNSADGIVYYNSVDELPETLDIPEGEEFTDIITNCPQGASCIFSTMPRKMFYLAGKWRLPPAAVVSGEEETGSPVFYFDDEGNLVLETGSGIYNAEINEDGELLLAIGDTITNAEINENGELEVEMA